MIFLFVRRLINACDVVKRCTLFLFCQYTSALHVSITRQHFAPVASKYVDEYNYINDVLKRKFDVSGEHE